MLEASFSLEPTEMSLTEQRNHEDTEEAIISDSSNQTCDLEVLI